MATMVAAPSSCELCAHPASVFCPADCAPLCSSCDANVHSANLIVQRHVRFHLCSSCHSPTSFTVTGPHSPHTVPPLVCGFCATAAPAVCPFWPQQHGTMALGVPLPLQLQPSLNPKFMAPCIDLSPESVLTCSSSFHESSLPAVVPVSPSSLQHNSSANSGTIHSSSQQQQQQQHMRQHHAGRHHDPVSSSKKRRLGASWAWQEATMAPRKVARVSEEANLMAAAENSIPEAARTNSKQASYRPALAGCGGTALPPRAPVAHPSKEKGSRKAAMAVVAKRCTEEAACLMSEGVQQDVAAARWQQHEEPAHCKGTSEGRVARDGETAQCRDKGDKGEALLECGSGERAAVGKEAQSKGHILGPKAAKRVQEVLASWHHDLYLEGPIICDLAFHMFQRVLQPLKSRQVSLDGLRAMLAGCLWIAAKLDEKQKNMPRASEVAEVARLDAKRVASEEMRVMSLLNWKPLDGFDIFGGTEQH